MEWNQDTIPYLLNKRAMRTPHDIAYHFPQAAQAYNWSTLWHEVRLVAKGLLRLGIRKGDSLAILMPDRIEMVIAMYAAACLGAVIVPINTYSRKEELAAYLQDAAPAVLIMGMEGHHQHYPDMLRDILLAAEKVDTDWIPRHIFVLDGDNQSDPDHDYRSFSELAEEAARVEDSDFNAACQAVVPSDPLIRLYTSGTTGRPKAVLRSTASFLPFKQRTKRQRNRVAWIESFVDRIAKRYSAFSLLPLYHLGGFSTLFTNLKSCNIRIVMMSHYHPIKAMDIIDREKCSFLIATPFMIMQMLAMPERAGYDLSSLLGVAFSSAAVNNSIIQKVTRELNLFFFLVSYGSSEAGAVANGTCFLKRKNHYVLPLLFKLLSATNLLSGLIDPRRFENEDYSLAGKVDQSVDIRVADPVTGEVLPLNVQGEVQIRSHRVMRYVQGHGDRQIFTADGWFKSGDLGQLDEKRFLTITGRLHRLISRGGEKISPVEVENALLRHTDVEEAFVLGIPDVLYGEQICACVVPREGKNLQADQLRTYLAPYLSAFKIPRHILFYTSFPMSATGKVSAVEMKRQALNRIGELMEYA